MLHIDSLSFAYDGSPQVVKDLSFELPAGSHLSVMGASGSGKSTLLKLLYGTLEPGQGQIHWHGERLLGPGGQLLHGHPGFQYVSQEYDLNPYMRVIDFLRMYLDPHSIESEDQRIRELLRLVQLRSFETTQIRHLSLGQQQRVALVKALLGRPQVLLLDEPFTHVDAHQKNYLRLRIFPFLKDQGVTVINATHESQDVFPFADRVLVLRHGENCAFGPTREVYQNPGSYYVSSLFGLVNQLRSSDFIQTGESGESTEAYVYAEEIELGQEFQDGGRLSAEARVERSFFQGSRYLLELRTRGNHLLYAYAPESVEKGRVLYASLPEALFRSRKTRD